MESRTLQLRRQTLRDLQTRELRQAAGGTWGITGLCITEGPLLTGPISGAHPITITWGGGITQP